METFLETSLKVAASQVKPKLFFPQCFLMSWLIFNLVIPFLSKAKLNSYSWCSDTQINFRYPSTRGSALTLFDDWTARIIIFLLK